MNKAGMDLLKELLLKRGDEVAIERGRLVLYPKSGKPVPDWWMKQQRQGLIAAVLTVLNIEAYEYIGFTTGFYGRNRYQGITVRFISPASGQAAHVIFNAHLTRLRTTKAGRKGSALPGKHFRISQGHHFYAFWLQTGLPIPKSLSMFAGYMGNLRGILFSASIKNGRMDAGSIRPISVRPGVIRDALMMCSQLTSHEHPMNKAYLSGVSKDSAPAHGSSRLQPISGTCVGSHVNTLTRKRDDKNVVPFPQNNAAEDQAVDDWVADFRAGRNLSPEGRGAPT